MVPIIAEVVAINTLSYSCAKIIGNALLTLIKRLATIRIILFRIGNLNCDHSFISFFADIKCVQMAICPAHGVLYGTVQVKKSIIGRHNNTPPYAWLTVVKRYLKLKTAETFRGISFFHTSRIRLISTWLRMLGCVWNAGNNLFIQFSPISPNYAPCKADERFLK